MWLTSRHSGPATAYSPISSNLDSTLTSCSRLCSSRHINLHCFMSFYPRALSFFPHFRHSGFLLSPMSVSVFFLPTIYGFSSFYRHRLTFYDWYPPSLLWLILWLIWRLGLSACWSHRGTRAQVLRSPPPFRPSVLVLGFLSTPRTLNGVAMVDRPHYHPPAPLLLTANLVFFFGLGCIFPRKERKWSTKHVSLE